MIMSRINTYSLREDMKCFRFIIDKTRQDISFQKILMFHTIPSANNDSILKLGLIPYKPPLSTTDEILHYYQGVNLIAIMLKCQYQCL